MGLYQLLLFIIKSYAGSHFVKQILHIIIMYKIILASVRYIIKFICLVLVGWNVSGLIHVCYHTQVI